MKTITELKEIIDEEQKTRTSIRGGYSLEVKKATLEIHYKQNINLAKLERIFGLGTGTVGNWKRALGKEQTGYKFGRQVRPDVRSICLIVKEVVETGLQHKDAADKYGSKTNTVSSWVAKYRDDYQSHIDNLPDGVPYLVKEEKMVYGNKNIEETRLKLIKQIESVDVILESDFLNVTDRDTLNRTKKKMENKADRLVTLVELQKEFGIA